MSKTTFLAVVAEMDPVERARAEAIIDEMEEEGRQTMELMPGAKELIQWLQAHEIPMAIVTRNNQKTTNVLTEHLLAAALGESHFDPVIARDRGFLPKPDPTVMDAIAKAWGIDLPSSSLLMVGDSFSNDIIFGINAGVRTALFDYERNFKKCDQLQYPDFVTETLWHLPRQIWEEFCIEVNFRAGGPISRTTEAPTPKVTLCVAAANGDTQKIAQLLSDGVDVNKLDNCRNTALIWAVEMNQCDSLEALLATKEAHVDHRGFMGMTAVAQAARFGLDKLLKILVEHGANLDIPNDKLQYPLYIATFHGYSTTLNLLLQGGANPLAIDRKGRTPAFDTSHERMRQLLLVAESIHQI